MNRNANLKEIQSILSSKASSEAKKAHEKFVPGEQRIYGVRTPDLNGLAIQYKAGGFDLVRQLWEAGALEEKILALKMMGKIAKKDPAQSLKLIRRFSRDIGNWAVCDAMGMQALKPILNTHQKEIFALAEKYNSSGDPWKRRLSLVLVEWYTRKKECRPAIRLLAKNLESDKDYYVRKAVIWIRRNLAKGK